MVLPWGLFSLDARSNKFYLFNYMYIVSGLWLEDISNVSAFFSPGTLAWGVVDQLPYKQTNNPKVTRLEGSPN